MKTTLLVVLICLLALEISSKRGEEKRKLQRRNKRRTPSCSAHQSCPADKFCVPFVSKCTRGDNIFNKKCYIDEHCSEDQTCSIFFGYCFAKPKCGHMKPRSPCQKHLCPCPDGYECRGRFMHQSCLPIEDESGKDGSGKSMFIVN